MPFSPGDLPDPGMKPVPLRLQHWQAGSLPLAPPGKPASPPPHAALILNQTDERAGSSDLEALNYNEQEVSGTPRGDSEGTPAHPRLQSKGSPRVRHN